MPSSTTDIIIKDPTWFISALFFFFLIFPTVMKMLAAASKATLMNILFTTWLSTALVPLVFVGFDMEIGRHSALFTLSTTFPLVHTSSFIFGVALGLLFIKSDRDSLPQAFSGFMATAQFCGMCLFFLTQPLYEGKYLLWTYNGMFLPVIGMFIYFVAMGRDALLCPMFRIRAISESLGSIALTVFVLQRFFASLAAYILASESPSVFWVGFWSMLIISAFFLQKTYGLFYTQQVLPWISANEDVPSNQNVNELMRDNPIQGWYWADNIFAKAFRLITYYGGIGVVMGFYMVMALQFDWKGFISVEDSPSMNFIVNIFKYLALLSLPSLGFSMLGHILFPPVLRVQMASLETLKKNLKHKIYFRIVTRGKHPNLVRANVQHASAVLRAYLPFNQYCLEVNTDNTIDLETYCPGMATELLVPKDYAPRGGAKFKARALQYAIEASTAEPGDWIVHLDEETRFDADTLRGILHHCIQEDEAIAKGKKRYGNVGQGVILYGTKEADNWVTTLADSVRVGDDFGKFRLQYELHEPLLGMHGSFVVCQNAVEKLITFDHGMEGSITEDAYFALVAQVQGIKFSWIDSFMYEQSPFSCNDFMHQRCRWFAGLWLICVSKAIPFINRATLFFFMTTWALTPFVWIAMTLCMVVSSSVPYWFRAAIGFISGLSTWGYILGFFFTYKMSDGVVRFLVLFALQLLLQPMYAVMELTGVVLGIVSPPTKGFHIVEKEGSALKKTIQSSGEPSNSKLNKGSIDKV